MSQFSHQCPRCEFAVSAEGHNLVCTQCGLVASGGTRRAEVASFPRHSLAHLPLSLWASGVTCGFGSICAVTVLRSTLLEGNHAALGAAAIMGVASCAPGTLRQWGHRLFQS